MMHKNMPSTVAETKSAGGQLLSAEALKSRVLGKCFFGVFRYPFTFIMKMGADGALWGRNNYGTEDSGRGSIDETTGAFTVSWENHWEAHTTLGYLEGESIHLFDAQTGEWRTTLFKEIPEAELMSYTF